MIMKIFNKLSISLILCLLSVMTCGAATAQDVLAKASEKLNAAKSLTANFSGSAAGTLTVSGDKFAITAGGFGIWYNGEDMWTYSKSAGETSITTPTPSELLETNPIEIIKSYSNKFDAEKVKEEGSNYTIKLTPKGKGNNVRSATLVINTKTWMPSSIDMIFANDTRMAINIDNISSNAAVAPNTFVYPAAKYPGIEVVDLR